MKIIVDQEGKSAIHQLCDIALKNGGINNLNQINKILGSTVLLPTPENVEPEEKFQPKSPKKEDPAASQPLVEKQEEKPKEEEPSKEEVAKEKPKEVEESPKEEIPESEVVEGLE